MLRFFGLALVSMTVCACGDSSISANQSGSDQPPIDIQVQTKQDTVGTTYNGDMASGPGLTISWDEINITSQIDQVIVKDVIVNRGNCSIPEKVNLFPTTLKYGQHLNISMHGCDVISVVVETDQGAWGATSNRND